MKYKTKKILIIIGCILFVAGVVVADVVCAYAPVGYEPEDLSVYRNAQGTGSAQIKAMSFNIRCRTPEKKSENNWSKRKGRVVGHIGKIDADIIGLQEATPAQLNYILKHTDGYAAVGESRDYACMFSEKSAIMYRTSVFELISDGTFWLSSTPEKPSKVKNAGVNRVCTYAILRHRATGLVFAAANTHLDHISDAVRVAQARNLIKMLAPLEIPLFITGDFNGEEGSGEYDLMTAYLRDSRYAAAQSNSYAFTFHNYGGLAGDEEAEFIDFCFVSDKIDVLRYNVDAEEYDSQQYSDHFSVTTELVLNP